jgi:hypothetical protein
MSSNNEFNEDYFIIAQNKSEELWNILSDDEKLLLFCAIVRRIHLGELVENKSYRGILYDIFKFDPGSYSLAQDAGFLAIHNSIININYLSSIIFEFIKENNFNISEEDIRHYLRHKLHK